MKAEEDNTPANPDPAIAAADLAQIANVEKAAELSEAEPQQHDGQCSSTTQGRRVCARVENVMCGDVDINLASLDDTDLVAHFRGARNRLDSLKKQLNACPPSMQNPMRRLLKPAVEREARLFQQVMHYTTNVRNLDPYDNIM